MTIFGYGTTTKAIVERFGNCKVYDDSFSGVAFDKNGNEFIQADMFDPDKSELEVTSPGIPPSNPLIKRAKNLISEYDLFAKSMPYSIWISGTNGKTTTTQMLQYLLKDYGSVCGGNIGTPLASMDEKANIWILETSSFTLHYTVKAKPNIYILLPISEDHLSWHGSFKEYEKSKLKPLDKLKEGEIAIIPSKYKNYPTNGYKICYDNVSDLEEHFDLDSKLINFKEPFLIDAMLSLAVSRILFDEVNYEKINAFIQDAHKLEEFKDSWGRIWVDDSKATNIDATIWALKNFGSKKIYLILGGDDKDALLEILFEQLINYDIELFLIGKNMKKLSNLSNEYNIKSYECGTLQQSVKLIDQKYKTKDQIAILSPAAASKDQFRSYTHRGDEFRKAVLNLL